MPKFVIEREIPGLGAAEGGRDGARPRILP